MKKKVWVSEFTTEAAGTGGPPLFSFLQAARDLVINAEETIQPRPNQ